MITGTVENIVHVKVDAIVNAANGVGVHGAGVAGAIAKASGEELINESKEICKKNKRPIQEGEYYKTTSGKLIKNGVKCVYHAVTMTYPGGISSLDSVSRSFQSILKRAIRDGIKSIAAPGLGIGIGRLNKESVARTMVRIAQSYAGDIDVRICDLDKEFIDYVNKFACA